VKKPQELVKGIFFPQKTPIIIEALQGARLYSAYGLTSKKSSLWDQRWANLTCRRKQQHSALAATSPGLH